jgi:hypothetical protein
MSLGISLSLSARGYAPRLSLWIAGCTRRSSQLYNCTLLAGTLLFITESSVNST